MEILLTWHGDEFNVELASKAGAEAFLSVKGCRIVDGSKGPFVSYPATKNTSTGKWWQHAWGSEKFNAAVLEKAQASQTPSRQRQPEQDDDSGIPF
jgi:DNA-binding cell septation regulator SpoVG